MFLKYSGHLGGAGLSGSSSNAAAGTSTFNQGGLGHGGHGGLSGSSSNAGKINQ